MTQPSGFHEFQSITGITLYDLHKAGISWEGVQIARATFPRKTNEEFYSLFCEGFFYAPTVCREWIKTCRMLYDTMLEQTNSMATHNISK